MKGRVVFWFKLDVQRQSGSVFFKLFGQKCQKCLPEQFEHAMWYPEEVIKVSTWLFLSLSLKHNCYATYQVHCIHATLYLRLEDCTRTYSYLRCLICIGACSRSRPERGSIRLRKREPNAPSFRERNNRKTLEDTILFDYHYDFFNRLKKVQS